MPTMPLPIALVKSPLLMRRLSDTYDLLIGMNRHYHAAAVLLAIERIANMERQARRDHSRIAELQRALDAECVARDRAEAQP